MRWKLHKAAKGRNQIGLPPWKINKKTFSKKKVLQCNSLLVLSLGKLSVYPVREATDSCRWYGSSLKDGGSMPPSIVVREHRSLTGFTYNSELKEFR